MENSITINDVTYDFISYDNPKNIILGSGQNCHKCDINLLEAVIMEFRMRPFVVFLVRTSH